MTAFRYTAVDRAGSRLSGTDVATSSAELAARLQQQRLYPLKITRHRRRPSLRLPRFGGGRALLIMTSELRTLLGAGMTVDRALSIAAERSADGRLQGALGRIRDAVRGGKPLADALADEPAIFSPIYIALVRAGEASGQLAETVGRLHGFLARREAVEHRIASAMVYPCILLFAAAGALLLLSDFVLPQFMPMFADAGKQLPLITRVVVVFGRFLNQGALPLLALMALSGWATSRTLREPKLRVRFDDWLLSLPVVGSLWRNLEAARLARTTGALLQAGANVPLALTLSIDVLANTAMRRGALRALGWVREGTPLSDAMRRAAILPALSIQLLAVGEETGRMDAMLLEQADLLEEAAERRLSVLLALLVPGLTIGVGLIVGSVMAAVMLAVLRLNELAG